MFNYWADKWKFPQPKYALVLSQTKTIGLFLTKHISNKKWNNTDKIPKICVYQIKQQLIYNS